MVEQTKVSQEALLNNIIEKIMMNANLILIDIETKHIS